MQNNENPGDISRWSIVQLQSEIQKKNISPVEVTERILEKIATDDRELNAFITVMEDSALNQARKAEADVMKGAYKGALHGIPIGLKDMIDVKGVPTTCASTLKLSHVADEDAEMTRRLRDAGAIIVGKQNMHSLAYGSTGDVSCFGPAKNPHDPAKITGGSSSGSAAAVAGDLCYGAIGSDTGGSIRIPAAVCGIVGMKPTFGLVSRRGALSLAPTLDTFGPMTKTVRDNALMLNAIAGFDPKDPFSVNPPANDSTGEVDEDLSGKKIGIPTSFYFDMIDPEIERLFYQAVDELKMTGITIEWLDIPHMDHFDTALSVIFATEVYASLEEDIQAHPEKIEAEIRTRILEGMFIKGHDYIKMHRVKHLALETFTNALRRVDVIMTPSLCAFPCNIGEREVIIEGSKYHIRRVYSRLLRVSNLTGFPAISVPYGQSARGLPNAIQLIGLPFSEQQLYRFAHMIEQLNPSNKNRRQ